MLLPDLAEGGDGRRWVSRDNGGELNGVLSGNQARSTWPGSWVDRSGRLPVRNPAAHGVRRDVGRARRVRDRCAVLPRRERLAAAAQRDRAHGSCASRLSMIRLIANCIQASSVAASAS